MTPADAWDTWADDYDQEQARLKEQRPSKAALKRGWHKSAVLELDDLADLYGVNPAALRGVI
ncbi:hypothetical protein ACN20G_23500 [Streptomyces sp. BI20]|uniref:hypothetical protein n=1 Tax=Streptomyces sp. BI20 TaxID=3403460 RepID=UPI003C725484